MKKNLSVICASFVFLFFSFSFFVIQSCAGYKNKEELKQITKHENKSYIGLTLSKAKELAIKNKVSFRVVEVNGNPKIVTMDYVVGRINAIIKQGKVSAFSVEGEKAEKLLKPKIPKIPKIPQTTQKSE